MPAVTPLRVRRPRSRRRLLPSLCESLERRRLLAVAAPTGLVAAPASYDAVTLSWADNSSNETGFKIERSPAGQNAWSQVGTAAANATAATAGGQGVERRRCWCRGNRRTRRWRGRGSRRASAVVVGGRRIRQLHRRRSRGQRPVHCQRLGRGHSDDSRPLSLRLPAAERRRPGRRAGQRHPPTPAPAPRPASWSVRTSRPTRRTH